MNELQKLREVKKIINKYFTILEGLPEGKKIDERLARELGIPQNLIPIINNAYKQGRVEGKLTNSIPEDELKERIKKESVPKAVISIQTERTKEDLTHYLTKSRAKLLRAVTEQLKRDMNVLETVFTNEDIPKDWLAGELRKVTEDTKQDWNMVIRSELINNKIEGEAQAILDGVSPYSNDKENTKVFKRPNPDACKHCKRLYLERDGMTPKIFTLAELMANGTNIGKKVAEWKPTLGIIHAHCQCQLNVMPEGTTFDKRGNLTIDKGTVTNG